jgi:hypothetical protein
VGTAEKNVGGRRIMTKKVEYIGEREKRENLGQKYLLVISLLCANKCGPAWSRSSSAPDGIKRNKFAEKNKNKCFGVNFFLHKQKGNDVI